MNQYVPSGLCVVRDVIGTIHLCFEMVRVVSWAACRIRCVRFRGALPELSGVPNRHIWRAGGKWQTWKGGARYCIFTDGGWNRCGHANAPGMLLDLQSQVRWVSTIRVIPFGQIGKRRGAVPRTATYI